MGLQTLQEKRIETVFSQLYDNPMMIRNYAKQSCGFIFFHLIILSNLSSYFIVLFSLYLNSFLRICCHF